MSRWSLATGLVLLLMIVWGAHTAVISSVPQLSSAIVELPGERLNRVVGNSKANRADRAAAIFALFKQHIKPRDSLQQIRRVLRDTAWVDEASLYHCIVIGGWIPVDMNFEDRTYVLHLFADKQGSSEWVIYFQLAGGSDPGKEHDDGFAFLRGKGGSKGESCIKEFALCYPDGKIEIFN